MRDKKVLFTTQAAMIAALYVALTLLANALGLANYAVQVRFSEALTVLPYFTPAAVPGLLVGCALSNLLTGCLPLDILFGSLATLLGAVGTYLLRMYKFEGSVPYFMLTVGIGEVISCGVLGMILLGILNKYRNVIFRQEQGDKISGLEQKDKKGLY